MSDKQPFLRVEHISKTFPGVKALQDVYFDIYPGEVHALVGENGAGKSTLIKILAGVSQPDKGGSIRVEGGEVHFTCALDATRKGISVIYQDFSLFSNLTVAENIAINQQIERNARLLNWPEMKKVAREALDTLGSDIPADALLENLSVAKQQIVAIASAIAHKAKMIIMDEPTSALSKGEVANLFKIIRSLTAQGIAIMFVSHKLDELFEISDRFTVFRDGTYVGTNLKEDLNHDKLISMMVGREVHIQSVSEHYTQDEVLLEVKSLSKKGNFKDISFQLRKGEVVGITGLVGAGRSELFQAVFGLNTPYAGEIFIRGKKTQINNAWDAQEHGIAYIPESRQTQGLVLQRTVTENITLPILKSILQRGLINRRQQLEITKSWIEKMDIRPRYPEREVRFLSGGNQQKVVLSKWLATKPDILIVDEPTNGVDVGAKSEIHSILRRLAKDGAGVIVISSELPEILGVSDRVLVMRRGRITGEFVNKELSQETIMSRAF